MAYSIVCFYKFFYMQRKPKLIVIFCWPFCLFQQPHPYTTYVSSPLDSCQTFVFTYMLLSNNIKCDMVLVTARKENLIGVLSKSKLFKTEYYDGTAVNILDTILLPSKTNKICNIQYLNLFLNTSIRK